jgi:hypothetical protein
MKHHAEYLQTSSEQQGAFSSLFSSSPGMGWESGKGSTITALYGNTQQNTYGLEGLKIKKRQREKEASKYDTERRKKKKKEFQSNHLTPSPI